MVVVSRCKATRNLCSGDHFRSTEQRDMMRVGTQVPLLLLAIIALIVRQSNGFVVVAPPSSSCAAFFGRSCSFATTTASIASTGVRTGTKMALDEIKVVPKASEEEIKKLGARNWPTWGCGVSKFPWTYEGTETCLILEGDVTVTPNDDRQPVTVGAGDICVFPDGMSCTWDVRAAIKKHYKFE